MKTETQFKLRLPATLKAQLDNASSTNDRSLTAEIVVRLEQSFLNDAIKPWADAEVEAMLDYFVAQQAVATIEEKLREYEKARERYKDDPLGLQNVELGIQLTNEELVWARKTVDGRRDGFLNVHRRKEENRQRYLQMQRDEKGD